MGFEHKYHQTNDYFPHPTWKKKEVFFSSTESPLTIPKIILRRCDCRRTLSHCALVTMCNIQEMHLGMYSHPPSRVLLIQGTEVLLWLSSLALAKGHSSHTLVACGGHLSCVVDPEQWRLQSTQCTQCGVSRMSALGPPSLDTLGEGIVPSSWSLPSCLGAVLTP